MNAHIYWRSVIRGWGCGGIPWQLVQQGPAHPVGVTAGQHWDVASENTVGGDRPVLFFDQRPGACEDICRCALANVWAITGDRARRIGRRT